MITSELFRSAENPSDTIRVHKKTCAAQVEGCNRAPFDFKRPQRA
jgi:hypothetical protein